MSGIAANLRQLPDDAFPIVMTLLGGNEIDVRGVTEDKKWVEVAFWQGGSATMGRLRVDTLELNASLDDLEVEDEPPG